VTTQPILLSFKTTATKVTLTTTSSLPTDVCHEGAGLTAGRLPCRQGEGPASADWPEEVRPDVATNLPPEVRALLVGVAEMEAGKDARSVDVLDCLVKALVRVCGMRDPAVECERDLVGAEERRKPCRDCGGVAGVRRRYSGWFGVARSGAHSGSATVAGFPSVSARGMAWYGRQNQ
jgi:hypothetical protein